MDSNMASSSSRDHGGFLRRFNGPENEPFFISDILFLRARVSMQLGSKLWEESMDELQAAAHPILALLSNNMLLCPYLYSHSCGPPPPPSLLAHLFHLSIAFSFTKVALKTAFCHTVHIYICIYICCPNMQLIIAKNHW